MSFSAPVVGSSNTSSSAVRPPMHMAMASRSSLREWLNLSSGRVKVSPSDRLRATIDTLWMGSAWGRTWPTMTWPASW